MGHSTTFTPPSDEHLLSLDALAEALPKPDDALTSAIIAEDSKANYVHIGAEIKTARVTTDARRIYAIGWAFWTQASDEQKRCLVGFSPELLAAAVGHAKKLAALDARATSAAAAQAANQRDTAGRDAVQGAIARRDQALSVLERIAGTDHKLQTRVAAKNLGAGTPANLASSLRGLASVGREILSEHQHKKDALAIRIKLNRVDAQFFASLEAAAAAVEDATKEHVAGGSHPVAQGDLDFNDGIQLQFLEHVLDAFEKAHDVDPTIPRLVPIATRRLLGSHAKKAANPVPPPAQAPEIVK